MPAIPSTLMAIMPTNNITQINVNKSYERIKVILKGEIIETLKVNDKLKIFIPFIKKYKLSENVIKQMKIENYEEAETGIENIIFLIEKIPKNKRNKFCIDNIMKKVRVHFLKYSVISMNLILKNEGFNNTRLVKIQYDFKSNLKKKDNLKDLESPIKDLLSVNDINRKIIENILKKIIIKSIIYSICPLENGFIILHWKKNQQ